MFSDYTYQDCSQRCKGSTWICIFGNGKELKGGDLPFSVGMTCPVLEIRTDTTCITDFPGKIRIMGQGKCHLSHP